MMLLYVIHLDISGIKFYITILLILISDHLAQFLLIQEETLKIPVSGNVYTRKLTNFERENFLLDLLGIDWKIITLINHLIPFSMK